ncbi:MAG: PilT/PilU family type 4a pilus ATPase [Gemmatimonadota bacterium]|nr:MAG: PilT/PilU family type 4a pilus ATPase [Gemmatimonadota bacterium]
MNAIELLQKTVEANASDLHLRPGSPPVLRIADILKKLDLPRLTEKDIETFIAETVDERHRNHLEKSNEYDFAISLEGLGRFRVNAYQHMGVKALSLRYVSHVIPKFEDLHLPPILLDLAMRKRGLIIVTGTAGSGKTTTLAAMIEHINNHAPVNIIAIEDPIEYVFTDKEAIIAQREVGLDTDSFHSGLRYILRQDPDVILIGEIRDVETMSIALMAAETGHLVFCTLHTLDAAQTIDRSLSFYPPHENQQIRNLLADTLEAIVAMRLLPRSDAIGLVPAVEVMVCTGLIRDYIRDSSKTHQISTLIEEGTIAYGMQSFDQNIMTLYQEGLIGYEVAKANCTNPADFDLRIKGIQGIDYQTRRSFET